MWLAQAYTLGPNVMTQGTMRMAAVRQMLAEAQVSEGVVFLNLSTNWFDNGEVDHFPSFMNVET